MNSIDLNIHIVKNKNINYKKCFNLFLNDCSYYLDKNNNKIFYRNAFKKLYLCKRTNLIDMIVNFKEREKVDIDKIKIFHVQVDDKNLEKEDKWPEYFFDYYENLIRKNKKAIITELKLVKSTTFDDMISEYDNRHKKEYVLMNRFGLFFNGIIINKQKLYCPLWVFNVESATITSHYKLEVVMREFRKWMNIDGKDGYTMNNSGIIEYKYIKSVSDKAYKMSKGPYGSIKDYWEKLRTMFNKGCKYEYLSSKMADAMSDDGYPMKKYKEW